MDNAVELTLHQRVELIERLVREGRRASESYGWVFVLWGLGHAASLAWDCALPADRGSLPWSILMPACGIIMLVKSWRMRRTRRVTSTIGRTIALCWTAATPALFLIMPLQAILVPEVGPVAIAHDLIGFCLVIGIPNLASGMILRLPSQITAAIVWWLGAVAFSQDHTMAALVAVSFALIAACEIALGLHLMLRESRARREAADV
jgi:hypothetical protein